MSYYGLVIDKADIYTKTAPASNLTNSKTHPR